MKKYLKKVALVTVSLFVLSGCARYAWVKPFGDPASFSVDDYACKQSALSSAPPAYQIYDPYPGPFGYDRVRVRCVDNGHHEVCRSRMVPYYGPPPTATDLNAYVRDDLYASCLRSKGWAYQQIEEAK